MGTSTRRIGLILSVLWLAAAVAPCVALADVLPNPTPTPVPPTTQTAATTTGTIPGYVPGRATVTISQDQNFAWYLFESMIFVGPLLLTLIIEVPVVAIAGGGSAASWKVGVLVNTLTNPVAVAAVLLLIVPAVQTQVAVLPYLLVAVVEIAVVVVEWLVFRWALGWSNRRAVATSVIANVLSFGIGFMILTVWAGV